MLFKGQILNFTNSNHKMFYFAEDESYTLSKYNLEVDYLNKDVYF